MLSGWKNSGKDVMSRRLANKYGFERFAFADALKDQVAERYGISRFDMDDPMLKERPLFNYPVNEILDTLDMRAHYQPLTLDHSRKNFLFHTPRSLLILDGSLARTIHNNIWVNTVVSKIMKRKPVKVVISDFRYQNELEQLRRAFPDYKILTIRVNRFLECSAIDDSERALDAFPFEIAIDNSGTLEAFVQSVDEFAKKYQFDDDHQRPIAAILMFLLSLIALSITIGAFLL
jgi:hypothetical protein